MNPPPRLIAVAGGTCSGKSVLCEGIRRTLGDRCTHVAYDNYYRSLSKNDHATVAQYNFDEPKALDTPRLIEDLKALKSGQAVEGPTYNFTTHLREAETITLLPREIILVEGILTLCDASLRSLFDVTFFVETPGEVRLARRIRRDVADRGRTEASVRHQWVSTVDPMHDRWVAPSAAAAMHTLDGTLPPEALLQEALTILT